MVIVPAAPATPRMKSAAKQQLPTSWPFQSPSLPATSLCCLSQLSTAFSAEAGTETSDSWSSGGQAAAHILADDREIMQQPRFVAFAILDDVVQSIRFVSFSLRGDKLQTNARLDQKLLKRVDLVALCGDQQSGFIDDFAHRFERVLVLWHVLLPR